MSWLIFSGEMMRALRDGRKSVTRRLIKVPESHHGCPMTEIVPSLLAGPGLWDVRYEMDNPRAIRCPQGVPGDKLYCRENWAVAGCYDNRKPSDLLHLSPRNIWYQADQGEKDQPGTDDVRGKWRPSIFMPRRFAREWVELVAVSVERVQEISRDEAVAEGVDWQTCPRTQTVDDIEWTKRHLPARATVDYRAGFAQLWDSLYGPGAWERNEYVWREEFRRIKP